jgi:hypothetical protein
VEFIGFFIAAGLGLWAWSDAKNLQRRSIRVGSFSPVAWGWLVALFAIIFGIMYLVQRPKAIADAEAKTLRAWQDAPPDIVDLPTVRSAQVDSGAMSPPPPPPGAPRTDVRYCTSCGTQMRVDAGYCPGCGRDVAEDGLP